MATESALNILLASCLNAGLAVRGVTASVQRDNQPRQQGVPSTPVILFSHIGTVNVGWPEKAEVWNAANGNFDHVETQRRESRYQIGGLAPQTPGDPTLWTTADYVQAAASIMQSDATILTLLNSQVGVRHITDIRSTWFVDDRGQNEENPSFDVVFGHQDVFTTSTPPISVFAATIKGE